MKNNSGDAVDIAGIWILQSTHMEDAQTGEHFPMPAMKGVAIMHPDGRMMALVTPAEQPLAETETQQAAAFQRTFAYSGRYRLEPPDRFVTSVDFCLWPSWLGSEQGRTYRLTDDTLELVTAPMRGPGRGDVLVRGNLRWVRERGSVKTVPA